MADIEITSVELEDPRIDDVIQIEKSLSGGSEAKYVEDVKTPFYMNPIFYYAMASMLGALAVWALREPFINDFNREKIAFFSGFLLFGPVAGIMGLSIGFTYGIANRNLKQAVHCGIVGIGVGLGATIVSTLIASILFGITTTIAASIGGGVSPVPDGEFPIKGIAFFILMCGRGLAWSIVSMGAGLGLGVSLKSKKLTLNGLAGGMVGGALGGLLFDPVSRFISGPGAEASLSRCIGIVTVGFLVGLFIGIFENISKEAWFLMLKGPLAGKQFILFKSPTVIGSATKCDIYLFKDPAIEPHHASVIKSGNKYLIEDLGSDSGTHVNGKRMEKHLLNPGDLITIGETVLKYNERERR